MRPLLEKHDLSKIPGRIFACGDIHGMFPLLRRELRALGFDPQQDRLILLGDLVDRGYHSAEAIQWHNREGVLRVRGNHEEFLEWSVVCGDGASGYLHEQHIINGGRWFYEKEFEHNFELRKKYAAALNDVPIAMEVMTPAGRRVGFVHAEVPHASWSELEGRLAAAKTPFDDMLNIMTWGLSKAPQAHTRVQQVMGIDHVFFGHEIVKQPMKVGNCSWLDTGAYHTARLTIVDVDHWIANQPDTYAKGNNPDSEL